MIGLFSQVTFRKGRLALLLLLVVLSTVFSSGAFASPLVRSSANNELTVVNMAVLLVDHLGCDAVANLRVGSDVNQIFTKRNLALYRSTDHEDFKPKDFTFKCGQITVRLSSREFSKWSSTAAVSVFAKSATPTIKLDSKKFQRALDRLNPNDRKFKFKVKPLINIGVSAKVHKYFTELAKKTKYFSRSIEDRIQCGESSSANITVDDMLDFFDNPEEIEHQFDYIEALLRDFSQASMELQFLSEELEHRIRGVVTKADIDTMIEAFIDIEKVIREYGNFKNQINAALSGTRAWKGRQEIIKRLEKILETHGHQYNINNAMLVRIGNGTGVNAAELRRIAVLSGCVEESEVSRIARYIEKNGDGLFKDMKKAIALLTFGNN